MEKGINKRFKFILFNRLNVILGMMCAMLIMLFPLFLISPAECMGEEFSELTIGIFQSVQNYVQPNEVWV